MDKLTMYSAREMGIPNNFGKDFLVLVERDGVLYVSLTKIGEFSVRSA